MMEPTIKTDKYELYLGDCLDVLPHLEPQSVDAVICDPPYGTTACAWDSVIPFEPMWSGIKGVIKDNGAIALFSSQPFTTALIMSNPKMFRYETIWEKTMPTGMPLANSRPMKYHENICMFYESQPPFNKIMEERSEVGKQRLRGNGKIINGTKRGDHGVMANRIPGEYREYDPLLVNPKSVLKFGSVPNCNGTKLHSTQKPVDLMSYLIKTYTNETETVLDFTMGSGSTGVACIKNNRYFIGIEKDEKYFEIAAKRMEDCAAQGMLDFSEALQ